MQIRADQLTPIEDEYMPIAEPERWMTYEREDGVVVYGASSAGACPRALVADRRREQPIPPSDFLEDVFSKGHRLEDVMTAKLEKEGYELCCDQEEYELEVLKNKIVVVGHIDRRAVRKLDGQEFVVEMKGAGKTVFPDWVKLREKKLRAHPRYSVQAMLAMKGLGLPLLYAIHFRPGPNDDSALEDGDLHYFTTDQAPSDWLKLRSKLAGVEAWLGKDDSEWPDCTDNSQEQMFCFYSWLHDAKPVELDFTEDEQGWIHTAAVIKREREKAERLVEELKQQEQDVKDRILSSFNQRGAPGKGLLDGIQISKVKAHMRTYLGKRGIAQLKEIHGDRYASFLDETPVPEQIRIKLPDSTVED